MVTNTMEVYMKRIITSIAAGVVILTLTATANIKTNEEIANEVIKGQWNNFPERKFKLEEAGYNYQDVQDIVNELIFDTSVEPNESGAENNEAYAATELSYATNHSSSSSAEDAFYNVCSEKGLSQSEIEGWAYIINNESSWVITATNADSGAYGLPQSLPGSKMATHGTDWQTNPYTQLYWMYDYMVDRYGSIQGAVNFWYANSWY